MPRSKSPLWRAGLLIGLLLAVAWLATACGDDDQSQSAAQQEVDRQTHEQQQESAPAQEQPTEQPAQPEQQPAAQQQEQQEQQETASSAPQPSQSQAETAEEAQQQSAPQQQAVQEQQGQQAQQMMPEEAVPEGTRLITLFGDLTEIVYALGAEEYLVARDASSIYPRVAEELPNLGFAGALNAEAILDFAPTMVIGTIMAGPPEVLDQLRQAGVDVRIIEVVNDLNAPPTKIRFVGEALGLQRRADALARDVERRTEAVLAASENDKPLRVMHIYIRRGGLQLVSGQGNEAQAIIEAAGGIDAAAESGIVGWVPLTPEALVAADPDVYLVMDRGLAVVGGIEGLLEIPGMAQTKAGQGPHIISMADLYLLGFGPRLPEAIADLAQFLRDIQSDVLAQE